MKINRQKVHSKYDWHCAYCWTEISVKEMQVDHIVPQRNFEWYFGHKEQFIKCWWIPESLSHLCDTDVNHIDNLMPACRFCNKYKDTFSIEDFRKQLSLQIERVNKTSANYRMAKRYGQVQEKPKPIVFYFEIRKSSY